MPRAPKISCSVIAAACLLVFVAALFLVPGCPGRTYSRDADIVYLRDVLGEVVLNCRTTTGSLPASFDQAMQATGAILGHRGNVSGGALWYYKSRDDCFFFISAGPNGVLEMGRGDDVVVAWNNGQWLLDAGGEFVDREMERR